MMGHDVEISTRTVLPCRGQVKVEPIHCDLHCPCGKRQRQSQRLSFDGSCILLVYSHCGKAYSPVSVSVMHTSRQLSPMHHAAVR